MLNIPKEIRNLFKMDGIKKNIRIHFPNKEREDITNDNILKDSFSFSERLCSRDNFKFGLCEANTLEFECFDVENIKGCEIEASLEVILDEPITITTTRENLVYDSVVLNWDTSFVISFEEETSGTLTWDWLDCADENIFFPVFISTNKDEEGFTAGGNYKEYHFDNVKYITLSSYLMSDLDITLSPLRFVYDDAVVETIIEDLYSIPYGRFVVDSCDRQTDYYNRKVVAYTKEIEWDKFPNPVERAKIDGTIRNAYNTTYNFNVDAFVLSNVFTKDSDDSFLEKSEVTLSDSHVFNEYEYLSSEIINNPYNTTWVNNDNAENDGWYEAIAYGNGTFVSVGSKKAVYSNDGGVSWNYVNGLESSFRFNNGSTTPITYNGVTYNNGLFVCIGNYGYSYYSYDGVNWFPMKGLTSGAEGQDSISFPDDIVFYEDVIYGNDRFVCVGSKGHSYYSIDGINWQSMNGFPKSFTNWSESGNYTYYTDYDHMKLAYGKGHFVCIFGTGLVYFSKDGVNWEKGTGMSMKDAKCVIFADDRFVSIVSNCVYISYDGETWSQHGVYDVLNDVKALCYENERFVAVGSLNKSYYSIDLVNWYEIKGLSNNIDVTTDFLYRNSIVYGDNKFVCVGRINNDKGTRAVFSDNANRTNKYVCNISINGRYYTPASNTDANKLYKVEFDNCENYDEIINNISGIINEYIDDVNIVKNNAKGPVSFQALCDILKYGVFKTRTMVKASTYENVYIPLNGYNFIYPYLNLNSNEVSKFYTSTNMLEKTFIMVPYQINITLNKKLPTGGKTTFDTVEVISETIEVRPFNNIILTSVTNLSSLTMSVNRYSISSGIYTIDQTKMYDLKSLVEGYAELNGFFGRYNRFGVFEFVKVNQNFGLYPAEDLYPMDDLYGRSTNIDLITKSYYINAVYDEEPTKHYKKVYVLFKNASDVETYSEKEVDNGVLNIKTDKFQEYSLTDNFIIKSCKFTTEQINQILSTVADGLQYISYFPMELESKGLPYIETGDIIRVLTRDGGFETIILSRNLSGEQLLFDNYQSRG